MQSDAVLKFIALSVLLCFFGSCAVMQNTSASLTMESAEIPPDMATEKFIIIGTLKGRNSYDKYMRKAFENYTGTYILADKNEIIANYQDVSKYRYVLDYLIINTGHDTRVYHYFIKDRKTNKNYQQRVVSGFFALEMRVYLKQIESVRKK